MIYTIQLVIKKMTIADATAALRSHLKDIDGAAYVLSKKQLRRGFVVIGREGDVSEIRSTEALKSARQLFNNYLFSGDNTGDTNMNVNKNKGAESTISELEHDSSDLDTE